MAGWSGDDTGMTLGDSGVGDRHIATGVAPDDDFWFASEFQVPFGSRGCGRCFVFVGRFGVADLDDAGDIELVSFSQAALLDGLPGKRRAVARTKILHFVTTAWHADKGEVVVGNLGDADNDIVCAGGLVAAERYAVGREVDLPGSFGRGDGDARPRLEYECSATTARAAARGDEWGEKAFGDDGGLAIHPAGWFDSDCERPNCGLFARLETVRDAGLKCLAGHANTGGAAEVDEFPAILSLAQYGVMAGNGEVFEHDLVIEGAADSGL